MSLINIEKTITLDVYDHDTTPSVVKAIQLDTGTRTVFAMIQNSRQDYDIGQNATVSLTVLRPDKTKVQITGQTFVGYTGTDGTTYGAKAELSDVALAVKGNLKAQFKITSGEQELRTEIFAINNGEALDAVDGDWAGDLDGHNLDEMAQDIEDTKAAVSEMETDVSELKEDFSEIKTELGMLSKSLDTVAFGGKTYRDIFMTNNKIPHGDFENGLDWVTTNTGDAVISEEEYVSKTHSLKCFGTSSVQIKKLIDNTSGNVLYVACKADVKRYSVGSVGLTSDVSAISKNIKRVTDGFETISVSAVATPAQVNVFFGTYGNASADAYIDDAVIIDLTACFGVNRPTTEQMDVLYDDWIEIKNSGGGTRLTQIENSIDGLEGDISALDERVSNIKHKPILVGAILDARYATTRWTAIRQLYAVAYKILDDPTYQPTTAETNEIIKGAICALPDHPTGMYQQYPFETIYTKDEGTQAIPASVSKVMTLVTGLEYIVDLGERVTVISADVQSGSGSILQADDIVTVKDLMHAMMLNSSNTAAMTFARYAGSKILDAQNGQETHTATECLNAFIAEMAIKAETLGMANSVFASPSGLSESNLSTVSDLLKLTIEACSYPQIQKIWNKKAYTIHVKGTNARDVDITTSVADTTFESTYYIFGGKTGTLSLSNRTAVALVLVASKKP